MTNEPHIPRPTIDQEAVLAHLHAAHDRPTPAAIWTAVADIPVLLAEIERLSRLLTRTRWDFADLLAAARATLAADHDGEPDPLGVPPRRRSPSTEPGRRPTTANSPNEGLRTPAPPVEPPQPATAPARPRRTAPHRRPRRHRARAVPLPLRTRTAHRRDSRSAVAGLAAAPHPPRRVAVDRAADAASPRSRPDCAAALGPRPHRGTRLRRDSHRRRRRLAHRRHRARPRPDSAAHAPRRGHGRARPALVDAPAPPRPRQGRPGHPRLARHRRSHRPHRLARHVRRRRHLGLARPDRSCGRGQTVADVVARVPAIESGLGTRPGAVRVEQDPAHAGRCLDARPRRRPARRRDPLARPDRPHPSPTRSSSASSRTPPPSACRCCAGTPSSAAPPTPARAASSTSSSATSPPAPTSSCGASTSRAAWNSGPGRPASPGSPPPRPRQPRSSPTPSPSSTPARTPPAATTAASGNPRRPRPRWSSSSTSTPNSPTPHRPPSRTPTPSPAAAAPSPSTCSPPPNARRRRPWAAARSARR